MKYQLAGRTQAKRKYRNRPTIIEGQRYDSQHEARVAKDLRARMRAGEIRWLARQVELQLTETVRMVVDFLYQDTDGQLHWLDAKGVVTRDWRTKQRLAKDLHNIEVETI